MTLRQKDGAPFKTDSGNLIYDCAFGAIQNAAKLAAAIDAVPGVVEHGLFVGIATTLLIAGPGEVEVIEVNDGRHSADLVIAHASGKPR